MIIGHSGSNSSAFYIYIGVTCVGLGHNLSSAHAHVQRGIQSSFMVMSIPALWKVTTSNHCKTGVTEV